MDSRDYVSSDTAKSLELTIAQLEMSMEDSQHSVNVVLDSLEGITDCLKEVDAELTKTQSCSDSLSLAVKKVHDYICEMVMALQYHDRLSQRTSHVEENLRAVSVLIQKPDNQHPALWEELQEKLKILYSTEQEQGLLAAVNNIEGTNYPKEVVQSNTVQPSNKHSETEFF